jgi:hypothetical protein
LLRTLVGNYIDVQPGIRTVDLAGLGVGELIPSLSGTARETAGDGGYWGKLSSPDPSAASIAGALLRDIRTRQTAPLDDMAARFDALTLCRQNAARDARAQGCAAHAHARHGQLLEVGPGPLRGRAARETAPLLREHRQQRQLPRQQPRRVARAPHQRAPRQAAKILQIGEPKSCASLMQSRT